VVHIFDPIFLTAALVPLRPCVEFFMPIAWSTVTWSDGVLESWLAEFDHLSITPSLQHSVGFVSGKRPKLRLIKLN
jgi:hypothetical protein